MTAGEAIGQARAMRPGCGMEEERLKDWLRREDGEIRARIIGPGGADKDFAEVGGRPAGRGRPGRQRRATGALPL